MVGASWGHGGTSLQAVAVIWSIVTVVFSSVGWVASARHRSGESCQRGADGKGQVVRNKQSAGGTLAPRNTWYAPHSMPARAA